VYYERPKDEEELQKREAIGTIRASRFVREFAKSDEPLDNGVVYAIHKKIFEDAWPEIAGVLRTEEAMITDSPHLPPHFSQVPGLMLELGRELKERMDALKTLPTMNRFGVDLNEEEMTMIEKIIAVTSWVHHKIVYIHPFVDGNGRTARLMANLVLERCRLIGISIKVERENKNRYRQALQQIDQHGDYGPLEDIIAEGLIDRYNGIHDRIV
jgi:cell filamentation protein